MKNKLITVTLLTLCSGLAWGDVLPAFESVDANQDSSIDRSEAANVPDLANNFSQIDSDGDGKLTISDYNAFINTMPGGSAPAAKVLTGQSFSELDANKDGVLSGEEVAFVNHTAEQFHAADKDKDSRLNQTEFKDYMAMPGKTDALSGMPAFSTVDTNSDGTVVKSEYQAAILRMQGMGDQSHMQGSDVE